MRVLLIAHNNLFDRPRGGEKVAWATIEYLQNFGYDCSVIMPGPREGSTTKDSIDLHTLALGRASGHARWMPLRSKVDGLVKRIGPDVVLVYASPLVLVNEICRERGIPYIVRVGSHRELSPKAYPENLMGEVTRPSFTQIFKRAFQEAASIIVNCQYGAKVLKKVYGLDSVVVYNPVFSQRVLQTSRKYTVIPAAEKVSPDFIQHIAKAMPDHHFLTFSYKTTSVKGNIASLGYVQDMSTVWEQANLFLFPCGWDFLGTSSQTIEAMLSGIPSITVRKAGFSELNFLTMPPNASVKAWVSKIREVEQKWDAYSKKTRKYIFEHYDTLRELEKFRGEVEKALPVKGRVLYYLKEGIGNLIQEIPSIKALKSMGYKVDGVVDATSPAGRELMYSLPYLDAKLDSPPGNVSGYDHFCSTFGTSPFKQETVLRVHDTKKPEREWYMGIARQLGYDGITPTTEVFYQKTALNMHPNSVVFAPGTVTKSWQSKGWGYFDRLAKYFHHVYLVGAESDFLPPFDWPDNTTDLIGKISFQKTISLIARSRLFVGNDGGLAHIAAVLGIPTFIIFGPTSIVKNLERGAIAVTKKPPEGCQPCQFTPRFLKCEHRKCLADLLPEMVIDQVAFFNGWLYHMVCKAAKESHAG